MRFGTLGPSSERPLSSCFWRVGVATTVAKDLTRLYLPSPPVGCHHLSFHHAVSNNLLGPSCPFRDTGLGRSLRAVSPSPGFRFRAISTGHLSISGLPVSNTLFGSSLHFRFSGFEFDLGWTISSGHLFIPGLLVSINLLRPSLHLRDSGLG